MFFGLCFRYWLFAHPFRTQPGPLYMSRRSRPILYQTTQHFYELWNCHGLISIFAFFYGLSCKLNGLIFDFNMALRIRHISRLAPKPRLSALSYGRFRSISTRPHQIGVSARPAAKKSNIPKEKGIICIIAGASATAYGLLLANRNKKNYPDDGRDVRALSNVPFGKLCSGWM